MPALRQKGHAGMEPRFKQCRDRPRVSGMRIRRRKAERCHDRLNAPAQVASAAATPTRDGLPRTGKESANSTEHRRIANAPAVKTTPLMCQMKS